MICTIGFRVLTPKITSYLLLHGGSSAIFWQIFTINCLTLVAFLAKFDALQPHQSYLILKQREMISHGLDDKELRLLDTSDHSLPSLNHLVGFRSPMRNNNNPAH